MTSPSIGDPPQSRAPLTCHGVTSQPLKTRLRRRPRVFVCSNPSRFSRNGSPRERGNYAALGERTPDFGSFLIMCTIDSGVRNLRPSPDFRDFASIETPCSLLRSTLVIDPPPSVP